MDTRRTLRKAAPRPPRDRGVFALRCFAFCAAMLACHSRWRICSPLTGGPEFVGESGMLCLTRIRPGAAAVAALLCLGVGAAAQQLPPAPGPIPPVRRGADGRIELAPPLQA